MNEEKAPNWLRALDIVIGLVAVALGIVVLLIPSVAVETLIFMLYVALLSMGSVRILIGALARHLSPSLRIVSIIAGLVVFLWQLWFLHIQISPLQS